MQQGNRELPFFDRFLDRLQRGFLLRIKNKIQMRRPAPLEPAEIEFRRLFNEFNRAALDQGLQGGAGHFKFADTCHRRSALILLQKGNDLSLVVIELGVNFVIELAGGFAEYGNLHGAPRVARGGGILARNPFLAHQVFQDFAAGPGGRAHRPLQRCAGLGHS